MDRFAAVLVGYGIGALIILGLMFANANSIAMVGYFLLFLLYLLIGFPSAMYIFFQGRVISMSFLGFIDMDDKGIYKRGITTGFGKKYLYSWSDIADVYVVRSVTTYYERLPTTATAGEITIVLKNGQRHMLRNVPNPEVKVEMIKQRLLAHNT
ncbi:hypothetical protein [Candidatus Acidianus copahuensis]|nr:hypothetical protein [Candidatus Acidianus copahuensis]